MKQYKCVPLHEEMTSNFQREIFVENEYNQFGVKIEEGDIVLDCGANVGIFTDYALELGASKIYSYECDDEIWKHFNENINNKRVIGTLGYIGDKHYNLTKIFNQHNLDKIDFAKIDIEGHEWDLFKNMDINYLNKVNKWAIEFHTFKYNKNISLEDKFKTIWKFLDIIELFNKNGYNTYYEHKHKEWDIVMLYVKKIKYDI